VEKAGNWAMLTVLPEDVVRWEKRGIRKKEVLLRKESEKSISEMVIMKKV
jgi:hypothetical protein